MEAKEQTGPERDGRSVSRATQLVEDAAAILDEEVLATGIDAARSIQGRLFGSHRRARGSAAVLPRLRRDAHEVIDLAADLLDDAIGLLGAPSAPTIVIREDSTDSDAAAFPVPTLVLSGAPGDSVGAAIAVENASGLVAQDFALQAPNLISPTGDRIAARGVSCVPQAVTVKQHEVGEIEITVAIPAKKPRGSYSGLLQAEGFESARAVLVVDVA